MREKEKLFSWLNSALRDDKLQVVLDGRYWVGKWRYWLVLGQYKLVLLGIRWYRVSKGLVCLYILEKVEIWSGDTDASQTDRQTTEYRATQLLSSIQFKLSHAMFCLKQLDFQKMVLVDTLMTKLLHHDWNKKTSSSPSYMKSSPPFSWDSYSRILCQEVPTDAWKHTKALMRLNLSG